MQNTKPFPAGTAQKANARPSHAAGWSRTTRPRTTVIPQSAASMEVTAALTAILSSGVALYSLATIIRQSNNFDARDKAMMMTISANEINDIVVKEEETETPAIPVTAAADEEPTTIITEEEEEEVLPIIIAPETQFSAVTITAVVSEEEVSAPVTIAIETAPAEEAEFEEDKNEEENEEEEKMIAKNTRITEPTFPQSTHADPAGVTSILDMLTANAPVGSTAPGSENNTNPSSSSSSSSEPEPELVLMGAPTPLPTDDSTGSAAEAMAAAREYESRLAAVLAEANLTTTTAAPSSAPAAGLSAVTVPDEYKEKVEALWATYQRKKEEESRLLEKQEKLTLNIAALDAAQQAQEEAVAANAAATAAAEANPLAVAARKVMQILAALVAFIMALVAQVTGGRFGSSAAN